MTNDPYARPVALLVLRAVLIGLAFIVGAASLIVVVFG